MKPEDDDWDEALFSSIMHSTHHDMPPPDADFLARLREQSTQAFLEAATHVLPAGQGVPPDAGHVVPFRRRSMFSLLVKAAAACVAAGVMIAAGFWSFFAPHETQMVFGAALDRVATAETLHLTITRDGQSHNVWYAQPNLLRWDETDERSRVRLDEDGARSPVLSRGSGRLFGRYSGRRRRKHLVQCRLGRRRL